MCMEMADSITGPTNSFSLPEEANTFEAGRLKEMEDQPSSICSGMNTDKIVMPDDGNGANQTWNGDVSCDRSGSSGSREGSVISGGVVTEAMLQEEQRLLIEKDSTQSQKEMPGDVQDLQDMVEQQRYSRLLHLLQRSTIYSKFLLQRMETQNEEDKKKQEKKSKKKKSKAPPPTTPGRVTRSTAEGKSPAAPPPTESKKKGHKRKATHDSYKISDFMDSQGQLKKMKVDGGEGEAPLPAPAPAPKAKPVEVTKSTRRSFKGQTISPRQPPLLSGGVMRSYQLDGMDWIKLLYENGVNGILGDEMGLGKTIQCISVIAYMLEQGVTGPFLVAAPLSTVPNWVAEFKRFAPKIPVVLYHGSMAEREELRKTLFLTQAEIAQKNQKKQSKRKSKSMKKLPPSNSHLLQHVQPVVVTSYEICMRDVKFLQFKGWAYLVVDEGHRIKNLNCKLIKALKSYDASNRLLLTGTPLQNNLAELWSLLNFLLPDIFNDLNSFQSWFDFAKGGEDEVREKIIAQEREQHVLRTLHQILTPFLLRRLKTDVEYSLPPKKEILVYAPLTQHQEKFYKSLLDKSILNLLENEKEERLKARGGGSGSSGVCEGVEVCEEEGKRARQCKISKSDCYSQLTDSQFDSIMTGEADLKDFVPQVEETKTNKKDIVPKFSATNIKMTSVYTMLRLCSNHPYLLEFPLTPSGDFKVDKELVQCAGKIRVLDRLLTALIKDGHKTLVFSQFTRMLDILEDYLEMRGVVYARLDGSMGFADRQINIAKFKSHPACMVFLLSTRAAGLGLNLTEADTVILHDSDWNPQTDLQAQDRCHRIGQSKPVVVYRLVTANTIDQRIVERAASKRKLEKMIIHKGKFKGNTNDSACDLSLEDLSDLLNSVDHDRVVGRDGQVISDDALAALLDRTATKRPVNECPDQGSDGNGDEGETSHSGVFKVLEDIGNVVCNKEEVAKSESNDDIVKLQDENTIEDKTDLATDTQLIEHNSINVGKNESMQLPTQDDDHSKETPITNEGSITCETMETNIESKSAILATGPTGGDMEHLTEGNNTKSVLNETMETDNESKSATLATGPAGGDMKPLTEGNSVLNETMETDNESKGGITLATGPIGGDMEPLKGNNTKSVLNETMETDNESKSAILATGPAGGDMEHLTEADNAKGTLNEASGAMDCDAPIKFAVKSSSEKGRSGDCEIAGMDCDVPRELVVVNVSACL